MTTLIITLPNASPESGTLYDYVLTPDGLSVATNATVPLALLPVRAERQDEVVAVVPMQALSWHQVQLPKGSLPRGLMAERGATRLRAILDGLLEDRLLDDPEQLHLAVQPQPGAAALVWVAACDRAWLKAHLQALAVAGHAASRIVPEFSPEVLAQTLYVVGEPDQPLLVGQLQAPAEGAGDSATLCRGLLVYPLSLVAVSLLAERVTQGSPQSVVAEPAVAALAESLFKCSITLQQRPQRMLQAAQTPWDLAQFDLLNANRDRRWAHLAAGLLSLVRAPEWRAARLALLALVLCNLVGLNLLALREQAKLTAKRQAVRAVLTGTFPKIPVVVDAPLQMAREVAALQRASGATTGTDLEAMLATFSAVVPAGYALTAIDYAAQELRLKGPKAAPDDAPRVVMALKQQGLAATWDGTQWLLKPGVAP